MSSLVISISAWGKRGEGEELFTNHETVGEVVDTDRTHIEFGFDTPTGQRVYVKLRPSDLIGATMEHAHPPE